MIKNILTAKDSKEIITKIKLKSLQNVKTYIVNHFCKLLNNLSPEKSFDSFAVKKTLFTKKALN